MRQFIKPTIILSGCLEHDACRFDGEMVQNDFVRELKQHVKFVIVCPEVQIGLGVPRDRIVVVRQRREHRLIQPSTARDLTDEMKNFANAFIDSLGGVDGFILKSKSPSCGIRDVKIREHADSEEFIEKDSGIFGAIVLEKFPYLAVEDEARLRNLRKREHFLTKIFAFAAFRHAKQFESIGKLNRFHEQNRFLFASYSRKESSNLEEIIFKQLPYEKIIRMYEESFKKIFKRASRLDWNVDILDLLYWHFHDYLRPVERNSFRNAIERYGNRQIPLSSMLRIVRECTSRIRSLDIARQTFLQPYPEKLIDAG